MVGNLRDSNLLAADTAAFDGGGCRQGGTKIDLGVADQRLDRPRETSLYDEVEPHSHASR